MVDPRTFALNIYFIVGAVIALAIVVVIVIALSTGVNIVFWKRSRVQAEQQEHRRKFRPDGQPYPPAARGLCDRCQRVYEKVYHLPSGQRRCPACYAEFLKEAS